jgi:UDP-glucose 4-epimerase
MRLLIVGGAGYIGSVVGAQCVAAGHEVVVLDDLSTGHADAVAPGVRLVDASVTTAGDLFAELAGGAADPTSPPVDAVLHFAAKSLVGESVEHPDRYFHTNVVGTLALLDAMREHGVPTVVFSSTAATYGEPDVVPIPETAPTAPTNPYGASKLAVDLALGSYAPAYGLAAVSLRYFNVAGALQHDGRWFGERHATETHLIPIALQVARGVRDELAVYGTDYPTPDGTCVRDYIHVVDLGLAHLAALEAAVPGRHQVVNLGSGSGNSVREVVEAVRGVTGRPVPTSDRERRAGDPAVLVASNAKAAEVLGWHPERDLRSMVADAWAFTEATA